uniref:RING-type domain-containing protein n=1 Tax=Leersia perrieri TaxID=77586 RepID=A0A0D9VAK7_9ORYZ
MELRVGSLSLIDAFVDHPSIIFHLPPPPAISTGIRGPTSQPASQPARPPPYSSGNELKASSSLESVQPQPAFQLLCGILSPAAIVSSALVSVLSDHYWSCGANELITSTGINLMFPLELPRINSRPKDSQSLYLTTTALWMRYSFGRKSLHAINGTPNPYEQAISIIGRTMSPFDDDNLIPCFGFGDASTHDHSVFSFYQDNRSCRGFEEVLERYRQIAPHLNLSGPTSFAPLIYAAISVVENSNWQYHVLVIIADGQVTTSNTKDGKLSPQEQATIQAIVDASYCPLSIVMVGVGDGPWDAMQHFDDCIPDRAFDNFQFVNFTDIMSTSKDMPKKEAAFALAALMEIPSQYKATQGLRPPEKHAGHAAGHLRILPTPNKVLENDNAAASRPPTASSQSTGFAKNTNDEQVCPICLTNPKDMAFQCGHLTCKECGPTLSTCPLCRVPITMRVRLYS